MSNKGGRVSPDYLADIAPEYAVYNTLQVLGISLTDTTPLEDLFNKSNLNIDKELDGFYEPTLFDD